MTVFRAFTWVLLLATTAACRSPAPTTAPVAATGPTQTPAGVDPAAPAGEDLVAALTTMEGRWSCDEPHSRSLVIRRLPDASFGGHPAPRFELAFAAEGEGEPSWRQEVTATPSGCRVGGHSPSLSVDGHECRIADGGLVLAVEVTPLMSPRVEGAAPQKPVRETHTLSIDAAGKLHTLVPIVDASNGATCSRDGA